MEVRISFRNVDHSPAFDAMVREKIDRLDRFVDGLVRADVRFRAERNPRIANRKDVCEVSLEGNGHHVRAKVSGPDPTVALDLVVARLERQLRKLKTRRHRHRQAGESIRTPGLAAPTDAAPVGDDGEPRIVKTKSFALEPMTPDDAILRMELLGHDFFMFQNEQTGRTAVVYLRDDGDVGLIDEAG